MSKQGDINAWKRVADLRRELGVDSTNLLSVQIDEEIKRIKARASKDGAPK